uniref:Putative 7.8-9.7 kDa secreted peptide n=1 Tax=Psorophora albipes TaxID=869069 RepID=T1E3H3_9DIPT
MALLFAFPYLIFLIAASLNSASANNCCQVDCEVINFRLKQGFDGGYCECVNGTGQYFQCGAGKTFYVRTSTYVYS